MSNNIILTPVNQMQITMDFRDCNGLWYTRTYSCPGALVGAIQEGELDGLDDGTEELMAVRLGDQFIWTSLGSDAPIHLENLSGFFG